MFRFILPMLFVIASSLPINAQRIEHTSSVITVIPEVTTLGIYETQGGLKTILVPEDFKPRVSKAGMLTLDLTNVSDTATILVNADDIKREPIETIQLDRSTYLILRSGRVWIDILIVDITKGDIRRDKTIIDIGPSPEPEPAPEPTPNPNPNPNPSPTVPDDRFDNIGKRTSTWSQGLTRNKELGNVYLQAGLLGRKPGSTVATIKKYIDDNRNAALADSVGSYQKFLEEINKDLTARSDSLSRFDYADWLIAVAAGLGVSQ